MKSGKGIQSSTCSQRQSGIPQRWLMIWTIAGLLAAGAVAAAPPAQPVVRHLGLVAPDTLCLILDVQAVDEQGLVPVALEPGDGIEGTGSRIPSRLWEAAHLDMLIDRLQVEGDEAGVMLFVRREGEGLGWLVGPGRNALWPVQKLVGEPLDPDWADNPASYRLTDLCAAEADNPGREPVAVHRKSRPHHKASTEPVYGGDFGERHHLYLVMAEPLREGRAYRLEFEGSSPLADPLVFEFNDKRMRSEALHVNLNGYESGQKSKSGTFSAWMGGGGAVTLPGDQRFDVIEARSGRVVMEGTVRLRTGPAGEEWTWQNGAALLQAGGPVYELDFSALDRAGLYRLRIPGIGVSHAFGIRKGAWEEAFKLQMRGFLHQRSGIALGPPLTEYRRPRNFHPADGTAILSCDKELFFNYTPGPGERVDNPFHYIEASAIPGTQNPDAWGGWADAADHDRRYKHLEAVHAMLELLEINPAYFGTLDLRLPESANDLPDLLDEALWGIGLWRRTQQADGEVIFGIESLRHPNRGEPSWMDTLPVAVVPGNPDAAYTYAGAAARMARVLADLAPSRADDFAQSARMAFQWAQAGENNPKYADFFKARPQNRIMAAWQLWVLTGDRHYLALFVAQFDELYGAPTVDRLLGQALAENQAAFLAFALSDSPPGELKDAWEQSRKTVVGVAGKLLEGASESAFSLLRKPGKPYPLWIIEAEGSAFVIAAHRISGEQRFLDALVAASQFAMGGNPLNLAYTSGLGVNSIRAMSVDAESAQLGHPTGIPAYGPVVVPQHGLPRRAWSWDVRKAAGIAHKLNPSDLQQWPLYEAYFESIALPAINEFTIHQGMTEQLFRWGYISQWYAQR